MNDQYITNVLLKINAKVLVEIVSCHLVHGLVLVISHALTCLNVAYAAWWNEHLSNSGVFSLYTYGF